MLGTFRNKSLGVFNKFFCELDRLTTEIQGYAVEQWSSDWGRQQAQQIPRLSRKPWQWTNSTGDSGACDRRGDPHSAMGSVCAL